jgi:hypothetical protein
MMAIVKGGWFMKSPRGRRRKDDPNPFQRVIVTGFHPDKKRRRLLSSAQSPAARKKGMAPENP